MQLDWIIQDPIDFEHKQYLILDYVKKTGDKLENFELYPAFQQLTLLYTSAQRVLDHGQFITLKREPEEIDDEILITDLIYNTIRFKDSEEAEEILNIAEFARDKFKDLFMVAKSLWSIINDSVSLDITDNVEMMKSGWGYFYFMYNSNFYVYEYRINRLTPKSSENKCYIRKLHEGEDGDIKSIIIENGVFGIHGSEKNESLGLDNPIFKVTFNDTFPLEGCLLSLAKRKVMNYIFQTIKIKDLKKNKDEQDKRN